MKAVVYLPRLGSDKLDVIVDAQTVQGTLSGKFVVLDSIGPGAHRLERSAGED
jgi:hypothetical protein